VVASVGDLDWGPVLSGYLGMVLFTLTLLALGLLMSTFTDNQIVAFIVAFILCGSLYFMNWLGIFFPEALAPVVSYVSVSSHLENMARGVVSLRDVLYYVTVISGALFLSTLSLRQQHA